MSDLRGWRCCDLAVEEVVDERRHYVELVFQCKMPGIEQVKFGVRQISQVRMRAIEREDLVVCAPNDQRRRLAFAEERLKLRIERNITAIIMEQVELNVLIAGTIKQSLIVAPIVWIDPGHVLHTVRVLELGGGRRHKERQRLTMSIRPIGPIGLDRIPKRFRSFFIGVAILDDERGDLVRVLQRETVSNGSAIIHEIERILFYAELLK